MLTESKFYMLMNLLRCFLMFESVAMRTSSLLLCQHDYIIFLLTDFKFLKRIVIGNT